MHQLVLLHGLSRTPRAMSKLARELTKAGYNVRNIGYPSRKYSIENLTADFVVPEIKKHFPDPDQEVHFVTHSLGGIIVRKIAQLGTVKIGRVVMLSPPNKGSEVVDKLGHLKLFKLINGPAGNQLGMHASSFSHELGPANFEVGIITGNRSVNLLLSLLIGGVNDGKVSAESAQLSGMRDFLVVKCSHPFIMNNTYVIMQAVEFLRTGRFKPKI